MMNTIAREDLITRADFYENVAMSLNRDEFIRFFGCEPHDPLDFDYSFDNVEWNQSLEFAYQAYLED